MSHQTRQGSPDDIRPFTDYLHPFVFHSAKPLKDLEWDLESDKEVTTQTRFRMVGKG